MLREKSSGFNGDGGVNRKPIWSVHVEGEGRLLGLRRLGVTVQNRCPYTLPLVTREITMLRGVTSYIFSHAERRLLQSLELTSFPVCKEVSWNWSCLVGL